MAKYDTYVLKLTLGKEENQVELVLSVLFEDGDDEQQVIAGVRSKILQEASEMQSTEFLKETKQ